MLVVSDMMKMRILATDKFFFVISFKELPVSKAFHGMQWARILASSNTGIGVSFFSR